MFKKSSTTVSLVLLMIALLLSTVPVSAKSTEPDDALKIGPPAPVLRLQRMEVQQIVPRHKKQVVLPAVKSDIIQPATTEVEDVSLPPVVVVEDAPDVPYNCLPFCDKNKRRDKRVEIFQ